MFSKLFTTGLSFGYDLGELGRYYRWYRELMDHWRIVLPADAILDVAYEAVVDDLEGARRLLDYCGLPWDNRPVLSFHKTDRRSRVAATSRSAQPLYRQVPRARRRYRAHVGPLLAGLGELAASQ